MHSRSYGISSPLSNDRTNSVRIPPGREIQYVQTNDHKSIEIYSREEEKRKDVQRIIDDLKM